MTDGRLASGLGMLSVVIATLNNERALVRTLSALVPAAATGIVREVIIADGGSSDDTLAVADLAGCDLAASDGPIGQRLKVAAAKARSQWLMFLQPGVILDSAWAEETAQFVQQMESVGEQEQRAATFRRGARIGAATTMFGEAMSMLRASLIGRVDPAQGLIIAKHHYDRLGGHRATASDAELDLLKRIGRRRIAVLRSRAVIIARLDT
jgi:glycosyltransferase involved in cell wall biosynthesis